MNARDKNVAVASATSMAERVDTIDWQRVAADLDADGSALIEALLSPSECESLAMLYPIDELFRSRVVMARHGFGRGEYSYFDYPLPALVAGLRTAIYPRLAPIANRWNESMGIAVRYPVRHAEYIERCHTAGQRRPTPSQPGRDFSGGEFVMTEARPRMQSRPQVVPLRQGDAAVIAVHHRPLQGTRGVYRVNLRHGVSRVRAGHRHTLGVIFHDAS